MINRRRWLRRGLLAAPRRFLQVIAGEDQQPIRGGSGRLEIAERIATADNPLTARVMVNRIWKHHFGYGLVRSIDNFGRTGDAPTHPELLDFLARRFVESGWSVKSMHRLIMLSAAYRLSSDGPDDNFRVDPSNDLYWKFDRQRLDAESIRDAMLMVSGDLDPSVAGAQPFPHPAFWNWTQHKPFEALYETNRRSVYLMVQRTQRQPYLSTFDGADPNVSTAVRTASITPVQALFMTEERDLLPLVNRSSDA